ATCAAAARSRGSPPPHPSASAPSSGRATSSRPCDPRPRTRAVSLSEEPPEDAPTEPTPVVPPADATQLLPVVPAVPAETRDGWSFETKLVVLAVALLIVGGITAVWAASSSPSSGHGPATSPTPTLSAPTSSTTA